MTFNCAPAGPWDVGQLDVPGEPSEEQDIPRVDTDGCVLNGALSSTSIIVNVTTALGNERWADSATYPTDFPFLIRVGGEVMQVNSCTGTARSQFFTVTRSTNGIVKAHASGTDVRLAYPTIVSL